MIKRIENCYSENFEEKLCYEKGNDNKYIIGDRTTEFIISKINEIIDYINCSNIVLDSTKIVIDENIVKQYFEDINREDL